MNDRNRETKIRSRILLLTDLLASSLSFMAALRLRYGSHGEQWQQQIYYLLLSSMVLFLVILYLYRERTDGAAFLMKKDPADNLVRVVKNQTIVIIGIIGVLYLSHTAARISRLVLGYYYIISILVDYILRMLCRRGMIRYARAKAASRRVLIVTVSYLSKIAVQHMQSALNDDMEIAGMALLDCSRQGDVLSGVPITDDRQTLSAMRAESHAFTEAFVYLPYSKPEELNEVMHWFEKIGVDAYLALSSYEDDYTENLIEPFGVYRAALYPALRTRCRILGVNFTVANVDSAVMYIRKHIGQLRGKYLCFCNVHTTVMSRENEDYRKVQNGAAFTFADGMPVARTQQSRGFGKARRVAGPDFMDKMFLDTMDGKLTHYFYGSTPETLEQLHKKLKENYPGIVIKGMYSPPFRELTPEEDAADIERINASGADIIWIGLGAPKQENWMARHEGKLCGVMAGVGAGFNFHAGTVQRAPKWIQRIGLEWLYRLMQEPAKLFRRYFVTNTKFIMYSLLDKKNRE